MKALMLLLLLWLCAVEGKVTVSIRLGTFTAGGIRCDWIQPCDFKFIVCVDDIDSGSRMSPCTYASRTTSRFGAAPINLLSKMAPISFHTDSWKGVALKVKVLDHDAMSGDDEIDQLSTSYVGPVGRRLTTALLSKTKLTVTVSSSCALLYYGSQCFVFCSPQDSDVSGHYTCHSTTGDKICLNGWKGVDCKEAIEASTEAPPTAAITESVTSSLATNVSSGIRLNDTQLSAPTRLNSNLSLEVGLGEPITVNLYPPRPPTDDDDVSNSTDDEDDAAPTQHWRHVMEHQSAERNREMLTNLKRPWLCGKMNLMGNKSQAIEINFTKISEVENSLRLSGNVSLTVSVDQQIQCNGSLVDAYQVDYCWNSVHSRDNIEQIIRNKFNDVFGSMFQLLHKEFCFNANKDSTSEIMYSVWGSLVVVLLLLAIVAALLIYKRKKRCHAISSDANFMFHFKKEPNKVLQVDKSADDKVIIMHNKCSRN